MSYRESKPAADLERFVARISFSTDAAVASPLPAIRVLPDGGVDLLVSVELDSGIVTAQVFGTKTRAIDVVGERPVENVAAHLHPGAATRLFGVAAWELTDRQLDLVELWREVATEVADEVARARGAPARMAALEQGLRRRLEVSSPERSESLAAFESALARVTLSRGRVAIRDLATQTGIGERRLERLFRDFAGISPKRYSRIVRFQNAVAGLVAGRPGALVALEAGYSDQPHMLRDFRALS